MVQKKAATSFCSSYTWRQQFCADRQFLGQTSRYVPKSRCRMMSSQASIAWPRATDQPARRAAPVELEQPNRQPRRLTGCCGPQLTLTKPPHATGHQPGGVWRGSQCEAALRARNKGRAKSWTFRSIADAKRSATRNCQVASCINTLLELRRYAQLPMPNGLQLGRTFQIVTLTLDLPY